MLTKWKEKEVSWIKYSRIKATFSGVPLEYLLDMKDMAFVMPFRFWNLLKK